MKRALDVIATLLVAPAALIVVLLAALAIWLESPGSPWFPQRRVGRNERPFTCYKLRTMRSDTPDLPSHEVGGHAITRVGALLRRLKIDELPQLVNVLAGHMSLVGPRPCLPSQQALIAARRRRGVFAVRPGITGLAQVLGVDMSDPERLAVLDERYVQTRNLPGDLKLIVRTVIGAGQGDPATGR